MRTVLALILALTACSKSEPPAASSSPEHVAPAPQAKKDPAAARKLIESGAAVIDVRSPDEFSGGHLDKAVNMPVGSVPSRLAEVEALVGGDKTKPIVVYCAAGGRAAKAKTALEAAGFTNVVNGGGYDDLSAARATPAP